MAVEYENDKKTSISESIKLSLIIYPLKVIFAYNYCNKRDDELLGDKAKITFGNNLLSSLGKLNNDEEYLIIFGNACAYNGKGTYEEFGYRGYVINGDNIKEL